MIQDLTKLEMKKTREGFGHALVELGEQDERIVALAADVTDSVNVGFFARRFPERFVQMGIAEQNMATVAVGMSLVGKIPFYSTYGAFATCRCMDQIRISICYSNANVKICGAHGGISVGPDGATHQALEEIAMMRSLPNMRVIVPCDYWQTNKATKAAAAINGPVFIRFGREAVPTITDADTPFEVGKGIVMRGGGDVAIIACGVMVFEALVAAETLAAEGIDCRVINLHTIKPIDRDLIVNAAKECGAIVTAEEHQIHGGMGSAVAEVLVGHAPVPQEFVAIMDRFGQSGQPEELLKAFGLKSGDIVAAVHRVLKRKSS
jgi:transketolase